MSKKAEGGFIFLPSVLIILGLTIVIGAGWYIYQVQKEQKKQEQEKAQAAQNQQNTPAPVDEVDIWKEFSSSKKAFSMKFPTAGVFNQK